MRFFDRYTSSYITEHNLPDSIELGRYAIVNDNELVELTEDNYRTSGNQVIHQELLYERYVDRHRMFEKIANDVHNGNFGAIPLIQDFDELTPDEFELALEEDISHIEAIFQDPHNRLIRTEEKVPVSKAKRISTRSYDYLAAHTEDWLNKSIVSFHPSRIITEEIIVDDNVYENQLLIAFVQKAINHINRRISYFGDIENFLVYYNDLMRKFANLSKPNTYQLNWNLPSEDNEGTPISRIDSILIIRDNEDYDLLDGNATNCFDSYDTANETHNYRVVCNVGEQKIEISYSIQKVGGWHRRIKRELTLAGAVYTEKDGSYKQGNEDVQATTSSRKRLQKLRDTLMKLRQYDLYSHVDQRRINSIEYRDTNVLVNHKHYRYLKKLWVKLLKNEVSKDNVNLRSNEEKTKDLQYFGLSIINYALTSDNFLRYSPIGYDTNWEGFSKSESFVKVEMTDGIVHVKIGNKEIRFITTGGFFCNDISDLPNDTYILAYDNNEIKNTKLKNVIFVSLRSIDSVEKVTKVLRETIVKDYVKNVIYKVYKYPPCLAEYEEALNCISSIEKLPSFGYRFISYPNQVFNKNFRDKLERIVKNSNNFSRLNLSKQKDILNEIHNFVKKLDESSNELRTSLRCLDTDCGSIIEEWQCSSTRYIECTCGFILDCTNLENVLFYINDNNYEPIEYGSDYVCVDMRDEL